MKADIVSGAILPDYELTEPAAEPGLVILKIYNRIGSLDCRPSKVPARICERYRRSAARTGTSREPKAAWKRGERDRFYPFGKSYAKVVGEQDLPWLNTPSTL
jgi:hypothetical protein